MCIRDSNHTARRFLIEPTRAQIKNLLGIHLANRRAVRALHVVRINFQLRLGVHRRVIGEQQIFICLLRIRLVRAFVHVNAPVKHRARAWSSRMPLKYSWLSQCG